MTPAKTDAAPLAALQVHLGLAPEELALEVAPGALPTDVNPWLLDLCAVQVGELGHWDRVPRPHDWENLLPLLRPGEELLWIVDYRRREHAGGREQFTVRLALKFNRQHLRDSAELAEREARFRAVVGHFRRQAFPESALAELSPVDAWGLLVTGDHGATWCVSGVPSPKDLPDGEAFETRDGDRPSFQSLNDVVEGFLHLPAFRLSFVVGRVADASLAEEFGRVTTLRNHLHPLVKAQVAAAEQTALSWQSSTAKGKSDGASRQESDHLLARLGRGLVTTLFGNRPESRYVGVTWDRAPSNRTWGTSDTKTEGWSAQRSTSRTDTVERLDTALELVDHTLERYAQNLYAARATGAYRAACFVQVGAEHADMLAGAVKGVLSGSHSKDRPMAAFEIVGDAGQLFRANQPLLDLLAPAAPVLTDIQACRYLLLPEAELPGVKMHRGVFLGRNALPEPPAPGDPRRVRRVRLGRFAFTAERDTREYVEIDERDLYSHLLVAGTTGSGKTRRVLNVLNGLAHLGDDLRIVVFETAKRTYRRELGRFPDRSPLIYTLGDSTGRPLRVNPFFFEPGTSLKRHVSVVSDALSELLPTEALIGPKMREAVERAYLRAGWDIEAGAYVGAGAPRWPTVLDFVEELRRVADELNYGAEVNANYRGALEGRARIFLDPTYQDIFSHDGDRPIEELFPEDTIVEMESLPPAELNVPGFLLAVLLERLRAHQARASATKRGWLVVVEEAHNVLARELEARRDAGESNGGRTLLQQVVRLLQEGREMRIGVMVVDQSPAMLARAVVKNTGTKIAMRLEDGEEIEEMGRSLGLDEDQARDLGSLRRGEAIVRTAYMTLPVKSSAYDADELPTPRPHDDDPTATPPSYLALDRAWSDVLRGAGPPPDAGWLAAQLVAAQGSPELVRFALRKALLAGHRAPLADVDGDLLALARRLHADARHLAAAAALLPLERRVLAALADGPLPDGPAPAGLAVQLASELLGAAWKPALVGLARARTADWPRAAAMFRAHAAANDGPWGPTVRLRAWHAVATADAALTTARTTDALDLLRDAGDLLGRLAVPVPDDTPLVHALARVLARHAAPERAAELEASFDA